MGGRNRVSQAEKGQERHSRRSARQSRAPGTGDRGHSRPRDRSSRWLRATSSQRGDQAELLEPPPGHIHTAVASPEVAEGHDRSMSGFPTGLLQELVACPEPSRRDADRPPFRSRGLAGDEGKRLVSVAKRRRLSSDPHDMVSRGVHRVRGPQERFDPGLRLSARCEDEQSSEGNPGAGAASPRKKVEASSHRAELIVGVDQPAHRSDDVTPPSTRTGGHSVERLTRRPSILPGHAREPAIRDAERSVQTADQRRDALHSSSNSTEPQARLA
jgi:hypothetical protein